MSAQGPSRVVSLLNKIADETIGAYFHAYQSPYVVAYVKGEGDISSGVITIEEADWDNDKEPPYDGTWSTITTVDASEVDGNKQKAIHLPVGCYNYLRARISTVIGGGGNVSLVFDGVGD